MMSLFAQLQEQVGAAYVVERELKAGGSARLFLAREPTLDRQVVIKVLPPELTVKVDAVRFRREIQLAAKLQHPHLVPVLAAAPPPDETAAADAVLEQLLWFSMPYIEGENLREWIDRRELLLTHDVVRLMRELASGLAYAHARGVVHRDIKPDNVLLREGIAMLSDFGIAKALVDASTDAHRAGSRVTTRSTQLGTPSYMAPEQITSPQSVDHRADIYAFGCLAYELLTGASPFANRSLRATLAAHVHERPVDVGQHRRDIPPALADIVMRCLAKDPSMRPHSATWIVRAIDNVPNGAQTATPEAAVSAAARASSVPVITPPEGGFSVGPRDAVIAAAASAVVALVLWLTLF